MSAQFQMTSQVSGGVHETRNADEFKKQMKIWQDEVKKAEERAQRFKEEVDKLLDSKRHMRAENASLLERVQAREQEIQRLHSSYKGGMTINSDSYQAQQVQEEHQQFAAHLCEIGQILGVSIRLPNCAHLIDSVHKLKASSRDLCEDNRELERQLEEARNNDNNQAAAGKMISSDEEKRLKRMIEESKQRLMKVEQENKRLRNEIEKKEQY